MPTPQLARYPHRFRTRFAIGLLAVSALTASVAPSAWADPQPLARAEAAIAANRSPASQPVRPNPDQQNATSATTYTGPCSEVCSGAGYGTASQPSRHENDSGARHRHNPPLGLSKTRITSLSEIQQGAKEAGLHAGVFGPSDATTTPPATSVRVTAPDTGFDWGDAGIGAGGMLALTLIGVAGVITLTNRRDHRARDQHAS